MGSNPARSATKYGPNVEFVVLLVAIDALLRSGRVDAAISVLERELGGGC